MTLEERTEKAVDRRLTRLREKYGRFPIRHVTVPNDPEYFEEGCELARAGWIGDAGAWVTDDDRVLLVRHRDAPDRWGTPGGGHVPGETLDETARREVREETGVACSLTGIYRALRKTVVHERDPDRRFHALTVWFEAVSERSVGDRNDHASCDGENHDGLSDDFDRSDDAIDRIDDDIDRNDDGIDRGDDDIEISDDDILEARRFSEPPTQVHEFLEEKVESWHRTDRR